jgi:FkbM family methyltransferase
VLKKRATDPVCMLGAFPPPVHGLAVVNSKMRERLERAGEAPLVLDIAVASLDRRFVARATRATSVARALARYCMELANGGGNTLYVGLSGGWGQLYELPFVGLARLRGAQVVLHHHSFAYLDQTTPAARLLTAAAGPKAVHVALSERMEHRLRERYPHVRRTTVVSNASMVSLIEPRTRQRVRTVGFLGNISRAKGVLEALAVAKHVRRDGIVVRIAGPFEEPDLQPQVQSASEAGDVIYEGPKYGAEKDAFLRDIDVLLFPSTYVNEAAPLTVLEALSRGIPVIAWERGCLSNMISPAAGLVVPRSEDFIGAAVDQIRRWYDDDNAYRSASKASHDSFADARTASEVATQKLVRSLMARKEVSEPLGPSARLRNQIRRVRTRIRQWQGKRLRYPIEIDVPRVSLGSLNARWTYSPDSITSESIIYSVGVGTDISFDLALIARVGATVHAFDPTPRSMQWLERQQVPPEFRFYPWGLADRDGSAFFEPPAEREHVSFRMTEERRAEAVECPVYRLRTIMERLGHDRIDLLKMDVEGAELDILPDVLTSNIDVKQLLVEFHDRGEPEIMQRISELMTKLHARGYRIFDVSANAEEIAWIKVDA